VQVWEKVFGVSITGAANEEIYSPEQLAKQITAMSSTVNRIGFIGLGAMGFGMATNLLSSNFCVLGYDVISYLQFLLHST
jgi:phosphoglycerate dehydrogenase-like enzyme